MGILKRKAKSIPGKGVQIKYAARNNQTEALLLKGLIF
jgi:hypothetical protein